MCYEIEAHYMVYKRRFSELNPSIFFACLLTVATDALVVAGDNFTDEKWLALSRDGMAV